MDSIEASTLKTWVIKDGYVASSHRLGNGEYVVIVKLSDYEIFLWNEEDCILLKQGLLELEEYNYARERERNKKRNRVRNSKKASR